MGAFWRSMQTCWPLKVISETPSSQHEAHGRWLRLRTAWCSFTQLVCSRAYSLPSSIRSSYQLRPFSHRTNLKICCWPMKRSSWLYLRMIALNWRFSVSHGVPVTGVTWDAITDYKLGGLSGCGAGFNEGLFCLSSIFLLNFETVSLCLWPTGVPTASVWFVYKWRGPSKSVSLTCGRAPTIRFLSFMLAVGEWELQNVCWEVELVRSNRGRSRAVWIVFSVAPQIE